MGRLVLAAPERNRKENKVEFLISEEGTEAIAQKCMGAETGTRAINPLVDAHMREAIATVESDNSICRVFWTHGKEPASCPMSTAPGLTPIGIRPVRSQGRRCRGIR